MFCSLRCIHLLRKKYKDSHVKYFQRRDKVPNKILRVLSVKKVCLEVFNSLFTKRFGRVSWWELLPGLFSPDG